VFTAASKLAVLAKALPRVLHRVKTVVYWGQADAIAQRALEVMGVLGRAWGAS
jgi:hypothetical protein